MNIGRALIVVGLILVGAGIVITLGDKLPFKLGRLPGDIVIRGKGSTFYLPVMTCVLLSVVGSLILWLLGRK
jgi:DUF2905 family protein